MVFGEQSDHPWMDTDGDRRFGIGILRMGAGAQ
jgi:hypothetical protein